jgi:alkylglycerol monooxygenase
MQQSLNPIVYAIPVFLATILIEAGVAWRRKVKVFDLADALTSRHFGVMSQLSGAAAKFAALGVYVLVFEHVRVTTWPTHSLVAWTAALILYDFCYYWLHRMGHEIGVLWAAHVVHHSSEYYNLTTALRQTSSGALLGWIFYLPMAVMGVPPLMFVTVGLIDLLYQYWVHTELIGRLGPLDQILVTPSNHRVHHGQNAYCIDRNYGGVLILWDRLFGTFVEERADEPVVYGVRKPLASYNPLWGNLHVYSDLWTSMKGARGPLAKLGVLFAPPGGREHDPAKDGFDPKTVRRYSTAPAGTVMAYVLFQYVLINIELVLLLITLPHLTAFEATLDGLFMVATMTAQGGLLEGRIWGERLEQARLFVGAGCAAFAPTLFGVAPTEVARAGLIAVCLVCLACLARPPHKKGVNSEI